LRIKILTGAMFISSPKRAGDGTYLDYLRSQYNRSKQIDPPFFREFLKYVLGIPLGEKSAIVRGISEASFVVLDKPFTKLGANIEARAAAKASIRPMKLHPSPNDSSRCFQDYMEDAQKRMQTGQLRRANMSMLIRGACRSPARWR